MSNIGWHFYKNYFKDIDYANLENEQNTTKIKQKINSILHQKPKIEQDEALGNVHFKATTTYPGLLLGSGYLHELPDIEGQVILGFDFDYTTGLPIIRGSSIKGVLRSAFKHKEYILELLKDKPNLDIEVLESEIFDNNDVFFDAVVEKYGTNILSDDYLAPHGEPTKNPIPLRFIKVSPNVTFRFDFILSDGILTKEEKSELFQNILADLGVGAKTNVGYGKFDDFSKYQTKEEKEEALKEQENILYKEAIESNNLEKLEDFKKRYPKSQYIDEVNKKINEAKTANKQKDIKQAFDNLDKTNPKHVKSFIDKYKYEPLANEYIEQLKNLNKQSKNTSQVSIKDLENAKNAKAIKNILEKVNVSQDDYNYIEEIITKLYQSLKGKQKKNFFKEAQIGRFINKDYETQIKSKLGVK